MQFMTLDDLFLIAASSGPDGRAVILDAYRWRQDAVKALATALLTAAISLVASVLVAALKGEVQANTTSVAVITFGAVLTGLCSGALLVRLRLLYRQYADALAWYEVVRFFVP
jgi:hypothetical protein